MIVTVNFRLDKRNSNLEGLYPVKLRITYNRLSYSYGLEKFGTKPLFLSPERFAQCMVKTPKGEPKYLLEERMVPAREEAKKNIQEVMERKGEFSFPKFNEFLKREPEPETKPDSVSSLWDWWNIIIEEKRNAGRVGTANVYQAGLVHFQKFSTAKELPLENITPAYLRKYYDWTLSPKNTVARLSQTTLAIHLRTLRTVINRAITMKALPESAYPFQKRAHDGGFVMPETENPKISLEPEELKALFEYQPQSPVEEKYLQLWKFSYLACGINFVDICHLRWKDLETGNVIFTREKTKYSSRKQKKINVPIDKDIQEILDQLGTFPRKPNSLVFGLISNPDDNEKANKEVRQVIKLTNKYLKRIGEKINLPFPLTTYVARHSYVTMMVRKGAPPSFIQQQIGHSTLRMTEKYIGQFNMDEIKGYQGKLLDF
jgi:integrase/recombinase XerD